MRCRIPKLRYILRGLGAVSIAYGIALIIQGGPARVWALCSIPIAIVMFGITLCLITFIIPVHARKTTIACLAALFAAYAIATFVTLAVRKNAYDGSRAFQGAAESVKPGMTYDETIAVLGQPDEKFDSRNMGPQANPKVAEYWIYNGYLTFEYIRVDFDSGGKTIGCIYDR